MKLKTEEFQETLLRWYRKNKRDLPWRRTKDPYPVWISEIMLQQTTVAAVIDYYHRFLRRFPTVESLARAKEEEVLALWSGLGYYSRARNLHRAAQKIVQDFQGMFPRDPEEIRSLPGIGRYTLGAVASIAFNLPLPLVDGNVARVYSRLLAFKGSPKDGAFQKKMWKLAETFLAPKSPGDFNQALMELGATVCTPQNPLCLLCPVGEFCKGRNLDPERFPEKKKGPETKLLKRVVAVIQKNEKILLILSENHRWMKDLWQLPGVLSENGESEEKLLSSLLRKWGLSAKNTLRLPHHSHAITHHKISVFPYRLIEPKGPLKKQEGTTSKWFSASELNHLALPSADRKILRASLTFRSHG
jgi:A/G-specific adenine glycosylase